MRRTAVLITMALILTVAFYTSQAGAQGPIGIEECRTIAESGSYVLARNLTASGNCLEVTVDFVTIDLSGFLITGDGTGSGILSRGNSTAVRNGTITGFQTGIALVGGVSIVEGLRVLRNGFDGIFAIGIVRNNIAEENGGRGILSGGGPVSGNVVTNNGSEGIFAGAGSVVSGNTARLNHGNGIFTGGGTVSGNTVQSNGGVGISVGCPTLVIANTAVENAGGNLQLNGAGCKNIDNVAP